MNLEYVATEGFTNPTYVSASLFVNLSDCKELMIPRKSILGKEVCRNMNSIPTVSFLVLSNGNYLPKR